MNQRINWGLPVALLFCMVMIVLAAVLAIAHFFENFAMTNKWRESTTFRFVLSGWVLVSLVFVYSQFGESPVLIRDFAETVGIILLPWLGREWRSAHYKEQKDGL